MTVAIVALAAVAGVLVGILIVVLRTEAAERESWRKERLTLVDRAIAHHVGEVVALDRSTRLGKSEPVRQERPEAVGLG